MRWSKNSDGNSGTAAPSPSEPAPQLRRSRLTAPSAKEVGGPGALPKAPAWSQLALAGSRFRGVLTLSTHR